MRSLAIEREYGSAGRQIGMRVSELAGIPYYDDELLLRAAEDMGISVDMMRYYDEKRTGSFLYDLANFSSFTSATKNNVYEIYAGMQRTIENLVRTGPCVLIGRCSTEILKGNPRVLRAFIYSSNEERKIQHIMSLEKTTRDGAKKLIEKNERERANYFKSWTQKEWKDRNNYDIELNSGTLPREDCALILLRIITTNEEDAAKF